MSSADQRVEWSYQQQNGEESIKHVVPVGNVSSPAKSKELCAHFKQVVQDEDQVDQLTEREKAHWSH